MRQQRLTHTWTPRVLILLASLSFVAAPRVTVHADDGNAVKFAPIRAKMQEFVDRNDISGAVTVVGRRSGIISIDAVGSLRVEDNHPMPRDGIFRIASMTKPITAIGIMILVDKGELSVDDPVDKHLPEFRGQMLVAARDGETVTLKKPSRPITIRDLLTHTSGLPGGMPPGLSDLYAKRNHTLAEAVMAFSQRPLDFEPGTKWAYCNAGIDTLGRIIEVVSGKSYEGFLATNISEPLGMKDTACFLDNSRRTRLAGLYEKKDGKLVAAANPLIGVDPEARYSMPAGGLISTGQDLAKLYQMMLGRGTLGKTRIISESSVATMTQLQTGDLTAGFTPGMGFGFGWAVVREPQGVTEMLSSGSFGHGGAFGTQAWIDPKQDLFVILLIQRVGLPNADGSEMRREFQSLAVGAIKN